MSQSQSSWTCQHSLSRCPLGSLQPGILLCFLPGFLSRHCLACFTHLRAHLPRYADTDAYLSYAGVLQASLWLVVSAIASVLLGIAFLQLFKHQPHLMTKVTIASQVGLTPSYILHMPSK